LSNRATFDITDEFVVVRCKLPSHRLLGHNMSQITVREE
jgi:hypothetical protein